MTASVILNPQGECTQGKIFHQRIGPVGDQLGHEDRLDLVAVFTGSSMNGNPVEFASFGAHLRCTVVVLQFALEGGVMHLSEAGAKFMKRDNLQYFSGVQLGHPTLVVEGEVVGFKVSVGAENAGSVGLLTVWLVRMLVSCLVMTCWGSIPNRFNSHV